MTAVICHATRARVCKPPVTWPRCMCMRLTVLPLKLQQNADGPHGSVALSQAACKGCHTTAIGSMYMQVAVFACHHGPFAASMLFARLAVHACMVLEDTCPGLYRMKLKATLLFAVQECISPSTATSRKQWKRTRQTAARQAEQPSSMPATNPM